MKVSRTHALTLMMLCFLFTATGIEGQTLKVGAWNLESGDSSTAFLAKRVEDAAGVQIWGLSEVQGPTDLALMTVAAKKGEAGTFRSILGTTGGGDRLGIIYNATRFQLIGKDELEEINVSGTVRAPLVALFRDTSTNNRFYFMVNHLYRGSAEGRHEQSKLLNMWAADRDEPVITVGDFNYDLNANNWRDHDRGFDILTANNVFKWARPRDLVRTQCSYNSVLDFVFVSGEARGWSYQSAIDHRPSDCPDDARSSDHRPIMTTFTVGVGGGGNLVESLGDAVNADTADREEMKRLLREHIRRLEEEIRELKELLDRP